MKIHRRFKKEISKKESKKTNNIIIDKQVGNDNI